MLSRDLEIKWKKILEKFDKCIFSKLEDSDFIKIMNSEEFKNNFNVYKGFDVEWNNAKYVELIVKPNESDSEFNITKYDIIEFEKENLIGKLQKYEHTKTSELGTTGSVVGELFSDGSIKSYGIGYGDLTSSKWVDTFKRETPAELIMTKYYLKLTPKGINYFKSKNWEYVKWILPLSITSVFSIISLIIAIISLSSK